MTTSSILKLVSIFLLVSSVIEVEAEASNRRGRVLQASERNLGIGFAGKAGGKSGGFGKSGRKSGGNSGGKSGGKGWKSDGKSGGKSGGKGETESSVQSRLDIPTLAPDSSTVEGRFDPIEDPQLGVDSSVGGSSGHGAFPHILDNANVGGSTSIEVVNESKDEGSNGESPSAQGENDETSTVGNGNDGTIDGGNSIGIVNSETNDEAVNIEIGFPQGSGSNESINIVNGPPPGSIASNESVGSDESEDSNFGNVESGSEGSSEGSAASEIVVINGPGFLGGVTGTTSESENSSESGPVTVISGNGVTNGSDSSSGTGETGDASSEIGESSGLEPADGSDGVTSGVGATNGSGSSSVGSSGVISDTEDSSGPANSDEGDTEVTNESVSSGGFIGEISSAGQSSGSGSSEGSEGTSAGQSNGSGSSDGSNSANSGVGGTSSSGPATSDEGDTEVTNESVSSGGFIGVISSAGQSSGSGSAEGSEGTSAGQSNGSGSSAGSNGTNSGVGSSAGQSSGSGSSEGSEGTSAGQSNGSGSSDGSNSANSGVEGTGGTSPGTAIVNADAGVTSESESPGDTEGEASGAGESHSSGPNEENVDVSSELGGTLGSGTQNNKDESSENEGNVVGSTNGNGSAENASEETGADNLSNESMNGGTETSSTGNNNLVVGGSNGEDDGMKDREEHFNDLSTAVFCPGDSCEKEILVNWIYAVEFDPDMTTEEKAQSVAIMELKLVSELLECDQAVLPGKRAVRHRHLVEGGVCGLNYMPLDAKNEDVVCTFSNSTNSTSRGNCETYFGRMEMYLQDNTDEKFVMNDILLSVRDSMQRSDFPSVDGIRQVWYLEPDLADIDGLSNGGAIINDPTNEVESFSTGTMIAFAALGLFVFAALVLGAFRIRRRDADGITEFGESTMMGSGMTDSNDPATLSAILPNSYKLDNPRGMSSIPEADDDVDSRYNGSVILSDGGYTSDGDSRVDDALYPAHFDPVLGYNRSDDDDMNADSDLLFENNRSDSYSTHRKKNLVRGSDVSLGARHSTVDVHKCNSASCKICNYRPKDVEFIHKSPNSPGVSVGKFTFPDDEII